MTILAFITENWLGVTGFVSGVICVWLLIRENVLTFPLGLLYSLVTVVVMVDAKLYADVLLNVYFVLMNAYGWFFWLRGGAERRQSGQLAGDDQLLIATLKPSSWLPLLAVIALGTALLGAYFDNYTDADLAYPDSFTTVLSFVAMWLQARKYLETWWLWLVVNVLSVVLYAIKAQQSADLYFYMALYCIYTGMAIAGWRTWRAKHAEVAA